MVAADFNSCWFHFFVITLFPGAGVQRNPQRIALDLTQNENQDPFERGSRLSGEQKISDAENE